VVGAALSGWQEHLLHRLEVSVGFGAMLGGCQLQYGASLRTKLQVRKSLLVACSDALTPRPLLGGLLHGRRDS
jgi:hypothetical protein